MRRRMFPHTVTIYNTEIITDKATIRDVLINHITILRGVLLDAVKASNVNRSGMVSADSVTLYIPFDVEAVDGITGEPKRYAGPMEWTQAEDKTGLWTMTLDGEGEGDSFFARGEVVEPDMDLVGISSAYDGVYNITKVDTKDYGGDMSHWQVGGA